MLNKILLIVINFRNQVSYIKAGITILKATNVLEQTLIIFF